MKNIIQAALSNATSTSCLNLAKCDLSECLPELIQLVAGDRCPAKLDLTACRFGGTPKDFCHFITTLAQTNTSITHLVLATNYTCSNASLISNGACIKTLLQHHKTLRSLDLSGHCFSEEAAADLTQGLQHNTTLRELILQNCSLNEESASSVMKHATHIEVLDLASNHNFTPEFLNNCAASRLLDENCHLQSLILNSSPSIFAVQEAVELTPFLNALEMNKTLQHLSLRCCNLKESVGKALLQVLTVNDTLISLDLEFSGFGLRDQGNQILIDLMPKFKALQSLKMLCRFPPDLVEPLLAAASANTTLRQFRPLLPQKEQVVELQSFLSRNTTFSQASTLVQPKVAVPASLLPSAVACFSPIGFAATYQVLQYWIAECL